MSDPRITDEMVDVAAEKLRDLLGHPISRDDVEEALEAAVPLLAPQPVVDREAVDDLLETHGVFETTFTSTERVESSRRILADAVLALIDGSAEATCADCGNTAPGIRHQVADPDPGGESAVTICLWPCGHSVPISPTQCDCVPADTTGAPY